MDHVSINKRSEIMAAVCSKDTKPEMTVRRMVHSMVYRYRLHRSDLPGKPDLTFPAKKKVIFVNGCFWHGHKGCNKARIPKTRVAYWEKKIQNNIKRDERVKRELKRQGWSYLTIWQCQLKDKNTTLKRIKKYLDS